MSSTPKIQNHFFSALRYARQRTGLTQEDFAVLSSRTYISSLERDLKSPTLHKVDQLADVMGLHPLTLLTLAYVSGADELAEMIDTLKNQISNLEVETPATKSAG